MFKKATDLYLGGGKKNMTFKKLFQYLLKMSQRNIELHQLYIDWLDTVLYQIGNISAT